MPAYSYRCENCGAVYAARYSFDQDSSTHPCKECGGEGKKIYEAPPVHFKGSGWGGK